MAKLKKEAPLAYAAIQDMRAIGDECLLATLPERAKEIKDKTEPVTIFLRGSRGPVCQCDHNKLHHQLLGV